MPAIAVRPAQTAERADLEDLLRRASLANPADRAALLANPDVVVLPVEQIMDGRVTVAEREGKVVGFSVLLPREDGDFELDGLFVEPDCWRCGIGGALVQQCTTSAAADGARFLHVVGNLQAEGFYAACGFQSCGPVKTQFGVAVRMKKKLQTFRPGT